MLYQLNRGNNKGNDNPTAQNVGFRKNTEVSSISWNCDQKQAAIVIQGEYGKDLDFERLEETLSKLQEDIKNFEEFRSIDEKGKLKMKFITPMERAVYGGSKVFERGCRYHVLLVDADEQSCIVYRPNPNVIYPWYKDVAFDVKVEIKKTSYMISTGGCLGFFKKTEEILFYEITFSSDYSSLLESGDIRYDCGNYKDIPITKEVLKEKKFYIRSEAEPVFKTSNPKISLAAE